MSNLATVVLLITLLIGNSLCLHIPFRREHQPRSTSVSFIRRSADAEDKFGFSYKNDGDNQAVYVGTLTASGKTFEVQLDTGSSDLWLDTVGIDTSSFTTTGSSTSIPYADGTVAEGPILQGEVKFGDFVINNQAFISAPGTNATSLGDKGLLGIGPPSLSRIQRVLNGTKYDGRSFLDNVFSLQPNEPNFISFDLVRSTEGYTDGGSFTIGEIPEEFSGVHNAEQLPVDPNTHYWSTPIEGIVVNGKSLTGHGLKQNTSSTIAILDTGSSISTAPPFYVDAIYSSIPDAKLVKELGMYTVPCDTKIDMTFIFGHTAFPIHPIDITFPTIENGELVCAGTFSYSDSNSASDWLLGDTFLRNVFAVYEFGSWTSVTDSSPYIKLLSTTDVAQADAEFESMNNARIQKVQSQLNRS